MTKTNKIQCTLRNYEGQEGINEPLKRYNLSDIVKGKEGGRSVAYLTEKRDIQASVTGAGAENIGVQKSTLIAPNYGINLFKKLGVKFINSTMNNDIPQYSGSNVYFLDEKENIPEGSGTFTNLRLPPYRMGARLDVSKQFIVQSSEDTADVLITDMIDGLWNKFIQTYLGNQAGTPKQPEGIFYGTANTVSNYNDFLNVENELLERGVTPNFYLTNPAGYVKLKNLGKVDITVNESTQDASDFTTANTLSGIPLIVSYNVGGAGAQIPCYALADWRDLYTVEYNKTQVLVDSVTGASCGITKLTLNAYLNAGWGRNSLTTALLV
jgi:hypothetical protein